MFARSKINASRIVVDRDYGLRSLETAGVIGRAAHSNRNVQSRVDRFAG